MKRQHEDNYEETYTELKKVYENSKEEQIENLRDSRILKYRVKTIKSGDMLEAEIYPLWNTENKKRAKRKKQTKSAQSNLNDKNAQKHLIRLVNTNFTKKDIWLTLTYQNSKLPEDAKRAKKDMENYINRLRRYVKKNNLPELKYIYVTEANGKRIHHHMICNFADRDKAEELWNGGGRTQARRLQPDDFGLEGLARYISKERKKKSNDYSKRYAPSRNLKQPKITVADNKISKRRVETMAKEQNTAQEIFEKIYRGYNFKDLEVKYSNYVAGAYLYARLKKIEPRGDTGERGRRNKR